MKTKIKKIIKNSHATEELYEYYNLIKFWSKKMNLISRKNLEQNFISLLTTSVNIFNELKDIESFIDIGTGAGFPSLPAKIIWKEKRFILIEPSKRALFLNYVINKLRLEKIIVEKKTYSEYFAQSPNISYDYSICWGIKGKKKILNASKKFVNIGCIFITGPKELDKMKKRIKKFKITYKKIKGKDRLFLVFAKKVPRGTL